MAKLNGTVVISSIIPTDSNDLYSTHNEEYGKGGYRTVSSIVDRDNIPTPRRKSGMVVYVESEKEEYRLEDGITNSDWVKLSNSSTGEVEGESVKSSNVDKGKVLTSDGEGGSEWTTPTGDDGTGSDGLSAYEIYVKNLEEGDTPLDELEWLDSLKAVDGVDGKSAYQSYLDVTTDNPKLSEAEWLDSLKGIDGNDGLDGVDGKSAYQSYLDTTTDDPKMSETEWLDSLKGKDGEDGVDSTAELTALTDKLEAKGVETGKVLTSKGDGTSEWVTPTGGDSGGSVDLDEVYEEIGKKQDTLVSGETIKTINNESVLGTGDISIEPVTVDASTLTEEQLDYIRDRQLGYGNWTVPYIANFVVTPQVTKLPIFNTKKTGNLVASDEDTFLLKKDRIYKIEVSFALNGSNTNYLQFGIYNDNADALISGTNLIQPPTHTLNYLYESFISEYVRVDIDTPISIRMVNNKNTLVNYTIIGLSSSTRINIMEISTTDMILSDFSINGKKFDENNNIDLEGLSTLSNPKLNVEILTEYRHPTSGKPLYTKTINFGSLPNATRKQVAHGVVDIEDLWMDDSRSFVIHPTGITYPTVSVNSTNILSSWTVESNKTNVIIITGTDRTEFTATITLLYTKTTDTAESPVRLVGGGSSGSLSLTDITDTEITSPSNDDVLVYDDTTGKWINKAMESTGTGSSDLESLSDVALDTIEDGDSLVFDSATGKWINKATTIGGINYTQSDTEPLDPEEGDEWFNLNNGILYKRVSDGTSHIWLDISGASYSNISGLKYVWDDEASRNSQVDMVKEEQGFQKDNYTVYKYEDTSWVELYKTSPDTVSGKSAYQSYLDTTADDPKMSEAEWIDSLNGGAGLTEDDQAKLDKIETIETKIENIEEDLTEIYTKDDINGLLQDTNVEGQSTLSSPKLNVETLTEYRHPVSGKPIYTKTIDFGALPNNTSKLVAHGVVDAEDIWVDETRSYVKLDDVTYLMSFTSTTNLGASWAIYSNITDVGIITGSNRTALTAIVTLLYTKTTDTASSPVRKVGSSSGGLDPDEDITLSAGKGVVMTSENGTMYKLYIDNDGRITTEVI